jgi:hypothetical protein
MLVMFQFYTAMDIVTNSEVALKTEPIKSRNPQLQYECRVYKALAGGGTTILTQLEYHLFCGLESMMFIYA